jgi:hypothetical protein
LKTAAATDFKSVHVVENTQFKSTIMSLYVDELCPGVWDLESTAETDYSTCHTTLTVGGSCTPTSTACPANEFLSSPDGTVTCPDGVISGPICVTLTCNQIIERYESGSCCNNDTTECQKLRTAYTAQTCCTN